MNKRDKVMMMMKKFFLLINSFLIVLDTTIISFKLASQKLSQNSNWYLVNVIPKTFFFFLLFSFLIKTRTIIDTFWCIHLQLKDYRNYHPYQHWSKKGPMVCTSMAISMKVQANPFPIVRAICVHFSLLMNPSLAQYRLVAQPKSTCHDLCPKFDFIIELLLNDQLQEMVKQKKVKKLNPQLTALTSNI